MTRRRAPPHAQRSANEWHHRVHRSASHSMTSHDHDTNRAFGSLEWAQLSCTDEHRIEFASAVCELWLTGSVSLLCVYVWICVWCATVCICMSDDSEFHLEFSVSACCVSRVLDAVSRIVTRESIAASARDVDARREKDAKSMNDAAAAATAIATQPMMSRQMLTAAFCEVDLTETQRSLNRHTMRILSDSHTRAA